MKQRRMSRTFRGSETHTSKYPHTDKRTHTLLLEADERLCPGFSGAEGLPGLHAVSEHTAAPQRPPAAGAPLHVASQFAALPGAPGGAAPQAHVSVLRKRASCHRGRHL